MSSDRIHYASAAWNTTGIPAPEPEKVRAAALTVCEHNTREDAAVILDRLGLTDLIRAERTGAGS